MQPVSTRAAPEHPPDGDVREQPCDGEMQKHRCNGDVQEHPRDRDTQQPWGCPDSPCSLPEGLCPEHGARAGLELPHGTAAPTPVRDLLGDHLLHSVSASRPMSSACFPPPVALPQGVSRLQYFYYLH